jgi:hypothetical protein
VADDEDGGEGGLKVLQDLCDCLFQAHVAESGGSVAARSCLFGVIESGAGAALVRVRAHCPKEEAPAF